MSNQIVENATKILMALFENNIFYDNGKWASGTSISELLKINPSDVNDAVEFLSDRSLIEPIRTLGTRPYQFSQITLNSRGKYAYHEMKSAEQQEMIVTTTTTTTEAPQQSPVQAVMTSFTPQPVGSPFGFTDLDWEYVSKRKNDKDTVNVVLGYQFKSDHYDKEALITNLKDDFNEAITTYNTAHGTSKELRFKSLGAGYGEHLFNQIARDIIGADIAVFETSDRNPNVMIEMGVALTWGVRVLPIHKVGCDKPPSDISGQTWARYENDCANFESPEHADELYSMVERAIQKKG